MGAVFVARPTQSATAFRDEPEMPSSQSRSLRDDDARSRCHSGAGSICLLDDGFPWKSGVSPVEKKEFSVSDSRSWRKGLHVRFGRDAWSGAISKLLLCTCLLLLPAGTTARAAAGVFVLQSDGRAARGTRIGDETNDRTLVIETVRDNILIRRSLPWSRVAEVRIGGSTIGRESILGGEFLPIEAKTGTAQSVAAVAPRLGVLRPVASKRVGVSGEDRVALHSQPCPYDEREPDMPAFAEKDARRPCLHTGGVLIRRSRVLGVRADPLSAYDEMAARYFPHGVPLSEIPFALDLLRVKKVEEVLGTRGDTQDGDAPDAAPRPPVPRDPFAPTDQATAIRVESVAARRRRPIRRITVSAAPVSSHGTADADAVALDLRGYDEFGRPVTLQGTLTATLHGQSQRLVRAFGAQYVGEPGRVERLASWTRSISSRELGLVLSLPRPLPDHNPRRAPLGEMTVRLLVPGQGVFEASSPVLLVRAAGPLRDRNLLDRGTRFFTGELTHGSRQPTGFRVVNPSAIRPNGRVLTVEP